ncbi:unnamed protein product, partial [Symbiodinium necroappetens]
MEKPAGTKDMGSWTAAVYTPEQQARLGQEHVASSQARTEAQWLTVASSASVDQHGIIDNVTSLPCR